MHSRQLGGPYPNLKPSGPAYPGQKILKWSGIILALVAVVSLVMNMLQMAMCEAIITMISDGTQEALDIVNNIGITPAEAIKSYQLGMILYGVATAIAIYVIVLGILAFKFANRPKKAKTLLIMVGIAILVSLVSIFYLVGGNVLDALAIVLMGVVGFGAYKNRQPVKL